MKSRGCTLRQPCHPTDSDDDWEVSLVENETINTRLAKLDIDRMFFEEEEDANRAAAAASARIQNICNAPGPMERFLSPLPARNNPDDSIYSHNHMFDDSCLQFEPTRELPIGTGVGGAHAPPSRSKPAVAPPTSVLTCSDDSSCSQAYFRYSTGSSLNGAEGRHSNGSSSRGSLGREALQTSPSGSSDCSKSSLYGCGVHDDVDVPPPPAKRPSLAAIREQDMSADELALDSLLATSRGIDCSRRRERQQRVREDRGHEKDSFEQVGGAPSLA